MISILKRLVIWLFEISCQVLLLCLLLGVFSYFAYKPSDTKIHPRDVFAMLLAISVVFMAQFGYLLTTMILRIFWTNRTPWLHPAISVVLFSIHLAIFFAAGNFGMPERLAIAIGGSCIVFATTFIGGYFLRNWAQPKSNELHRSRNAAAETD